MRHNGMFKAVDFAQYIIKKYEKKYNKLITPLKLQKSLYLCFAHWGGLIKKGSQAPNEIENVNISPYLFTEAIEAWSYGPVVPTVYHYFKTISFFDNGYLDETSNEEDSIKTAKNTHEDLFDGKIEVKEFIDELLDELFEISDFKLVEITHRDKSWQRHFDPNNSRVSKSIPLTEILEEYAQKY